MQRALTPAPARFLALFLAAGIGFVGPALVEPDPADPMAGDSVAALTAMQAGSTSSSPLPDASRVRPISTNRPTERTISCNNP